MKRIIISFGFVLILCAMMLGCTPERRQTETVRPSVVTPIAPETNSTEAQIESTAALTTNAAQTEQQSTVNESVNTSSITTVEVENTEEDIPESYVVDVGGDVGIGGT